MKALLRIGRLCLLLLLLLGLGGYLVLTHPGVQQRLLERRLPVGSSIESIHVTMGQLSVSGLVWHLADGTRVRIGTLETTFKPFAALFKQTIQTGLIQVKDMRIERPGVSLMPAPKVSASTRSASPAEPPTESYVVSPPATKPLDHLHALKHFEWLLDIEGIHLEGLIDDGDGGQYQLQLDAPPIRPGQFASIQATLQRTSAAAVSSGFKSFDSSMTLRFKQSISGGIESLELESNTTVEDAGGDPLFTMYQELTIDQAAESLLRLDAHIKGLRAPGMPARSQDFTVALRLQPTQRPGEWQLAAEGVAGEESRPSTSLQVNAVLDTSQVPVTFSANLSATLVSQADLSLLSAALMSRDEAPLGESVATPRPPTRPTAPRSAAAEQPVVTFGPPPWAGLDGRASVQIDQFRLQGGQVIESLAVQALVSAPMLSVDSFSVKLGDGNFEGSGALRHDASQSMPYRLHTDIHFAEIDPAWFVDKHEKSVPLQGQFKGVFELVGAGDTPAAALEDSTAKLQINGAHGVLSAFDLDERKQLGLELAGLLGQHLDRPGITALTHTIPYFKEIPFTDFVLELTRGADHDKRILIPQLRLTGDSLLLDASGLVGASELSEVMKQPMDLHLTLGAKGPLTEYLQTLGLLQPGAGEDGFTHFNQTLEIGGTLADPNTDALMELLNQAAKGALSKSNRAEKIATANASNRFSTPFVPESKGSAETSTQPQQPVQQSKQERRREEIEMGLDILDAWFGD